MDPGNTKHMSASVQEDVLSASHTFGPIPGNHVEWLVHPPCAFLPVLRCFIYPETEHDWFTEWTGPDLLSSLTHSEDIYGFIDAIWPGSTIAWLDLRVTMSLLSGQVVVDRNFVLTRDNWYTDSLRYFQLQIDDIISPWRSEWKLQQMVLELFLWPRREHSAVQRALPTFIGPQNAQLDPHFFVQNIVENFS